MFTSRNTTLQLEQSGTDVALIPFGSTEQFGPYLPMHIDCMLAEMYAQHYGKVLNAYVLPIIPLTPRKNTHISKVLSRLALSF